MALQVQAGRLVKESERDPSDVIEKTVTAAPACGTEELAKAKETVALEHVAILRELLEKNARTGKCMSYEEAMAPIRLTRLPKKHERYETPTSFALLR